MPDLDFLSPPQSDDELGRLGLYRVLKVLGQGGMGMVFKAEDPQLERTVALKVMLPEIAQKKEARERFLREARAAAKLEHDHIIAIHQVGEDRGIPFIAMPFLKGMSVDDWLKKKGRFTIPQVLRLGREIAKGLGAAHERGLVHRDIKPANLWLDATAQGRIKILDFGLARATQDDTNLTQEGAIVGTPAYMAPEQAGGGTVDARSDLFSLGAVLYLLATGQKPFPGNSTLQILSALATTTPKPVRELNPEAPPAFADLVMKLLEKDPANRPSSARVVVDAIIAIERDRLRALNSGASAVSSPTKTVSTPSQLIAPSKIEDESTDSFLDERDLRDKTQEDEPPRKKKAKKKKPSGIPLAVWLGGAGMAAVLVLVALVLAFRPRTASNDIVQDDQKKATKPPAPPIIKPIEPKPAEKPLVPEANGLFNGKDFTGWKANPKHWAVENGDLVGRNPDKALYSRLHGTKPFRNFHLSFRANARLHNPNHSGTADLHFRASDEKIGVLVVSKDAPTLLGFYDGRQLLKLAEASPAVKAAWLRDENHFDLKVVANCITLRVNGVLAFDGPCPAIADEGTMSWQLSNNCAELRVRDVRFEELSGTKNDGWRPVFTKQEGTVPPSFVTSGKSADFVWKVRDGEPVLVGSGNGHVSPFKQPHDLLKNFQLRFEYRFVDASQGSATVGFFRSPSTFLTWWNAFDGKSTFTGYSKSKDLADLGEIRAGKIVAKPDEPAFELRKHVHQSAKLAGGTSWNRLELTCLGSDVVQRINGEVIGVFANIRSRQPDGSFKPLDSGGLTLGVDGGEIEFRRIEIRDITELPSDVQKAGASQPLFDGKELAGWKIAASGSWTFENGELVARHKAKPAWGNVARLERAVPRDFEMSFDAFCKNAADAQPTLNFRIDGYKGVGLRMAAMPGRMFPFDEKGPGLPLLYDAPKQTDVNTYQKFILRVVGKRVTLTLNGVVVSDKEHPKLPEGDRIEWELSPNCPEMRLRDVRITDLSAPKAGWQSLFNGKDLAGWTHPSGGSLSDVLTIVLEDGRPILQTSKAPPQMFANSTASFRDVHFRLEFKLLTADSRVAIQHNHDNKGSGMGIEIRTDGPFVGSWKATFDEGEVRNGRIMSIKPASAIPNRWTFNLPNGLLVGKWHRLEIVRVSDTAAYLLDGRWIGAIANYRVLKDGKMPEVLDRSVFSFGTGKGIVAFRNIGVREITSMPAEVLEAAAWQKVLTVTGSPPANWALTSSGPAPPGQKPRFEAELEDGEIVLRAFHGGLYPKASLRKNYHLRFECRYLADAHILFLKYHDRGGQGFSMFLQAQGPAKRDRTSGIPSGDYGASPGEITGGKVIPTGPWRNLGQEPIYHAVSGQRKFGEWNQVELICLDDVSIQRINGKIVSVMTGQRRRPAGGPEEPITEGAWGFWTGGPTEFRRVEIREIDALPADVVESAK